jgi:hypothetical protein
VTHWLAVWMGAAVLPAGSITWKVEVEAAEKGAHDMLALTRGWIGSSAKAAWSGDERSLTFADGVGAGTWTVSPTARLQGYAPAEGGEVRPVAVEDLDVASPELRALLPSHYETPLRDTGRTTTLLGVEVAEVEVVSSPFVRGPTTLWIARSIAMPSMRLQLFTADAPRVMVVAPLPVSVPVGSGVVLKAVTVDQGVRVTWTATECTPCAAAVGGG